MRNYFLAIITLLIALVSCNNELNINAPWQDVSVVYGMLNQGDDTNWVRIHRTYLGTEGINGGSQSADSLYYNNLNVSIQELKYGININYPPPPGQHKDSLPVNTWMLVKDSSKKLDSGFFTTEGFHLYRLNQTIDPANFYKVVIDKPDGDGNRVTSTTPIVENFDIKKPIGQQRITFGRKGQDFIWEAAKNARIYQAYLRFYYLEVNAFNPSDSIKKFVDYNLGTKLGSDLDGGGTITDNVTYESFYRYLYNAIGVDENLKRFFRGMDIYVTAGADDLATYISVSQPAQGIVQDKPLFTNVNNGIGIFSSVGDAEKLAMDLSTPSLDSLVRGIYTCELKFGKPLANGDTCFCVVPGVCN